MTIDVLLCDSAVTNFLLSSIIFIITNKSFFVWNNYRVNILNSDKINDNVSNIDDNNDNNIDIMVDKEFIDFTQNGMINTIVVDCTHPTAQQFTHHLKHPKQRYFIGYINVVYTHSCIFMHFHSNIHIHKIIIFICTYIRIIMKIVYSPFTLK